MSDVLLDFEKKSLEFQLKVTESPLSYIKQQCVQESRIALAIYIPYPILMKWHSILGLKECLPEMQLMRSVVFPR